MAKIQVWFGVDHDEFPADVDLYKVLLKHITMWVKHDPNPKDNLTIYTIWCDEGHLEEVKKIFEENQITHYGKIRNGKLEKWEDPIPSPKKNGGGKKALKQLVEKFGVKI